MAAVVLPIAGLVVALVAVERETDVMQGGRIGRLTAAALTWATPVMGAAPAPVPAPPVSSRPTVIGINPAPINYFATTMPFANLALGSDWLDSRWQPLAAEYEDADGQIRALPAGNVAYRFLTVPPTGPEGIEVRCTWTGSGTMVMQGGGPTLESSRNGLRFRLVNQRGKQQIPWLALKDVDPRHPPRDLDCREAGLAASVRFRPAFVDTLRGYRVLRFMDWQNANANVAVSWRDRSTPASPRLGQDGVPIEDMLALAREIDADAWFVMPWNADDAYVAGFARMVRAGLPAGRSVYVEVGNEIWNTGFPAGRQAVKEGLERKLGTDEREAGMRRYAQRTGEVMRIWEAAFVGRGGLVRVLATQHVLPLTAQIALGYGDTAAHVDALATAPYFGGMLGGTDHSRDSVLAHLAAEMPASLQQAMANRRVAAGFGKRYIGYEGGYGVILPAQVPLAEQLQHDPAMYDLYRQFLAGWQRDGGDVLCLFNSTMRPGPYGSFGLAAWEDETLDEAPKLRAVREAIGRR
jgi:hypothetical protein